MLKRIQKALEAQEISVYSVSEVLTEGVELYFVRNRLDMRRRTRIVNDTVTVFRDFEEDGVKYRGSFSVLIQDGMTEEEIEKKLKEAYSGAAFVKNQWYPIPGPEPAKRKEEDEQRDWEKNAMDLAQAALEAEDGTGAFLNSMEVFSKKTAVHLINSQGIDAAWIRYSLDGEFVVQCREPQDVETYEDFHYGHFDRKAVMDKVRRTLAVTRDRASALTAPAAGRYRLLLSGKHVETVMSYFKDRSHASLIYQKYSGYRVGSDVQTEGVGKLTGDRISASLLASAPFSEEGIPMENRPLLKDGVLQTIHGDSRFCWYLGTEPTGEYEKMAVEPGTAAFEELKTAPCLYVVSFSDFQMDSLSGSFGGEIRLAYLFEENRVTCVTGGSVNGNILTAQKSMRLSKETQDTPTFSGPYAVRMEDITVAGI